jgi:flagellar biosynthesis protein FliR
MVELGEMPLVGDLARHIMRIVATAFRIGILVFGLLFSFGLDDLSRLMPQMQVFFIDLPLSIMLGMLLLLVVGSMMGTLVGYLEGALGNLAPHT